MKKSGKLIVFLICLTLSLFAVACSETPDSTACTEHTDVNEDGKCDNCGVAVSKPECTEHTDADGDEKCDTCGASTPKPECTEHNDENTDGKCDECGAEVEIIFANQPRAILEYTDTVLTCDIHTRARTKRILKAAGAKVVCGLDDILNASVNGSGFNENYGLLGSNKSTEESIKLFPHNCQPFVLDVQKRVLEATGKHGEVMVYGDGAFKDPKGKIWELADPVVSPAYTDGLVGTPNELKLKYLADNDYKDLSGEELKKAISESIKAKDDNLVGNMASQGTTPRQLTDLIGSLCDLTSGSGDKGTPVVLVQGYFDNYTT